MTININDKLLGTLQRMAEERTITPEKYIENYIESHLLSQYKLELISTFTNQKLDAIPTFEVAIKNIATTIKTRDYVEPKQGPDPLNKK